FGPYLFKYLTKRLKVDSSLPTKEQATQEQVWLSTLTAAAVGLAYLGDTSYVEKLKEVMKDKDYGPRIKMQTIVALTHLAGPASVEFLAGLIRDMRDKNPKKDRRFRTLRYNYFGPLAKIADVDGAKIARKLMQEEADKEVKRGMLLSEPLLEVAEFCKTQIDCWKRMLYFDVDVERANCRKDEKQCPTKILVPQKIMMQAKAMFIERGKKCAKDRGCWTKVYDDLVASTAFSRGMSRFKKRLAALKKGKDALSDRAQKTLSTSLERLPVQVRMTRKDKLEFRQQIREKAALILAFNKNHEPSVQALRGFLSNKDANVRDMVLFALERQADKGAIPLLAEQIKKEKGKADLEYIGDRMQLTIERLKTGNGTVQQAPKTNDETPKKDDDAPKKKKKRKRRKKKR
ncbi:MAG: HEAT repeat domain-containing protein, partial [Myxococcales bacterium]|nr:HEAT repeat domain-containing protein [Myxococcales bacterium]